jgi:hypothetical protein
MHAARASSPRAGGMTSHAAVVARGMGKPCVVGCRREHRDRRAQGKMTVAGAAAWCARRATDHHIDGGPARSIWRAGADGCPALDGDFGELMGWADEVRRCACAPTRTPRSTRAPRARFGAEGIGLCRTEHMFFDESASRRARDDPRRRRERAPPRARKLLPLQRARTSRASSRRWRPAGHDPPARSAAARVPAPTSARSIAEVARHGRLGRGGAQPRRAAARVQPDARPPRLPPGHHVPRDLRDAGPRHLRGRLRAGQEGRKIDVPPRDHDPAGRHARRSSTSEGAVDACAPKRCSPAAARSTTSSAR